jgi:hypothetical protein
MVQTKREQIELDSLSIFNFADTYSDASLGSGAKFKVFSVLALTLHPDVFAALEDLRAASENQHAALSSCD